MKPELPNCAQCPIGPLERSCRVESGKAPPFCPTENLQEPIEAASTEYDKPEVLEFARQASIQEAEGYGDRDLGYGRVKPLKPRIVEIIEFSKKMNYRRLGLLFCFGLRKEAKIVGKVLSERGFEVVSVVCKVGRIPKERIGIREDQKIAVGHFESMCNPISQAMIANNAQCDFNILLGLCVGHDSLVFKYSEAPCTVLAVKDRLLGHNPLAAVYTIDSYYRSLKEETGPR
jgi:uncharacterized metal-binding protein